VALGCGGEKTYRISGKVTFKGQPVPSGKIYFIPDGSKGNSGASGYADIKDGQYDTAASGGRGAPPGPVKVVVQGVDPSSPPTRLNPKEDGEVKSRVLFAHYETTYEVPKSSSTKNIDVPAEAGKGPVAPKSGIIIP
jgi:hypothetical protein